MCFDFQPHEPLSPKPNLFHHFSKLCPDARHSGLLTLLAFSTTFINPLLIYFPNLLLTNNYKKDKRSRFNSISVKVNDYRVQNP